METRISLDAFRDRSFAGKVRRIAPYVLDLEKQARTVDIEVAFTDTADFKNLLAGYSADVEIILATRTDTLRIPTEAVIEGKNVFVYSPSDKNVHLQEITTGLANWANTEIISGVEVGQLVVVNVDKPGLVDGAQATTAEEKP